MRVYPRVGGGNVPDVSTSSAHAGLSPRGRGKPGGAVINNANRRSIPAWAGETSRAMASECEMMVYPRVGGGNASRALRCAPSKGLSPRGRGKPLTDCMKRCWRRSIPAWAGETPHPRPRADIDRVYPRVGGGNRIR